MTASNLFGAVKRLSGAGKSDIKMCVDGDGAHDFRYHGSWVDSAEFLNILNNLLPQSGYVVAQFTTFPELELYVRNSRQPGDLYISGVEAKENTVIIQAHTLEG